MTYNVFGGMLNLNPILCLCVCLCVRLSQAGIVSYRTDRADFWHTDFLGNSGNSEKGDFSVALPNSG